MCWENTQRRDLQAVVFYVPLPVRGLRHLQLRDLELDRELPAEVGAVRAHPDEEWLLRLLPVVHRHVQPAHGDVLHRLVQQERAGLRVAQAVVAVLRAAAA